MKSTRLALLLAMASPLAYAADDTAWPTRAWPTSTPAAEGLDARPLEAFDQELSRGDHGYVDSMLVIRHGRIVFERSYAHDYARLFDEKRHGPRGIYNYYDDGWHPFYRGTRLHTMQSVSKSVTSLLVGIAIGRGEIEGVDALASRYLKGFRMNGDARQARLTLKHLLTMTAGIAWDETTVDYTDPKNTCAAMEASKDWVQFVLDQPMAQEPGQSFVYNSGATQLLAEVLRQATGKQADDYARQHLFGPIGIEDFYWKRIPTGLPDTEGGLYLAPRDPGEAGAPGAGRRLVGGPADPVRGLDPGLRGVARLDVLGPEAAPRVRLQMVAGAGARGAAARDRSPGLRGPAPPARAGARPDRRLHRLEHLRGPPGAAAGPRHGARPGRGEALT